MTRILFPSQSFDIRIVDPDFDMERAACTTLGLASSLLDHTRALRGQLDDACSAIPRDTGLAIYRGWMFRAARYADIFGALAQRGVHLINDPAQYRFCHQLPDAYSVLEGNTPRSVWLETQANVDFARMHEILGTFGTGPVIVKDFVKSQKHYWKEACFIPDASDHAHVEAVTRRFLELQGEDLNGGLVFRELVSLEILGHHPRSGMPLGAEVRTFWLDGELLLAHPYWSELPSVTSPDLPLAWLSPIAKRIPSRFFTIDIGHLVDGTWTIMELGDAQVTGLPSPDLLTPFYTALRDRLA